MTTTAAPRGRTTVIDRIAHWALDPDGDLYGDECERLRWYEGTAIAASLQSLAVPWSAAVLVWIYGRDAVVPLAIVLAALFLPLVASTAYVQRRRIDTAPPSWSRKRITFTVLHQLPFLLFAVGAMYAMIGESATLRGALVGILAGSAAGVVMLRVKTIRRRRREATPVPGTD
jgi:hypothetical protein